MKKNSKKKMSSYGFWISLLSVIFVLVQFILQRCGVEIPFDVMIETSAGFIFILISAGVITNAKKENLNDIKEDIKTEINKNNVSNDKNGEG